MEKNGRIVTGDERNLVLLQALLYQGMSVEDAFVFLRLEDKEGFIARNNLGDKLEDKTALRCEIAKRIEVLVSDKN